MASTIRAGRRGGREVVLASAGALLFSLYSGGYACARVTHRLVHYESCGDEWVAPGHGAWRGWGALFAPAILVEEVYWLLR